MYGIWMLVAIITETKIRIFSRVRVPSSLFWTQSFFFWNTLIWQTWTCQMDFITVTSLMMSWGLKSSAYWLFNSFSGWQRRKLKKNTRKNETKTKIKPPKLRVILPFVKGLPSQRVNDTECGSTSWRLCDIHIKRPILYIRNSTRLFSVPQYPESTKTIILAIHSARLRVWYSTSFKYLIRQRTGSRNW